MLACEVLRRQGIEVTGIIFQTPFFGSSRGAAAAKQLGIPYRIEDITDPHLAMVKAPVLLILDEPCQGLDVHNRRRLLEMLATIVANQSTQMIYVSHRPDEIPAATTHELHLKLDGSHRIKSR